MISIFLDESGIHTKDGKSAIAIVYVEVDKLTLLENRVLEIEKQMKIGAFHWAHTNWKVRKKFLDAILKEDFFLKIAIISNPFSDKYYGLVLRHLIIENNIKTLVIDGRKSETYVRKLKKTLRNNGIVPKKIKMSNDKSYPALRIADLSAGIVRSYYEQRWSALLVTFYKKLKQKIRVVVFK